MDSPVVRTVLNKAPLAEHANERDERMRSPRQDEGMLPTRLGQPEADLQRAQVEVATLPLQFYSSNLSSFAGYRTES